MIYLGVIWALCYLFGPSIALISPKLGHGFLRTEPQQWHQLGRTLRIVSMSSQGNEVEGDDTNTSGSIHVDLSEEDPEYEKKMAALECRDWKMTSSIMFLSSPLKGSSLIVWGLSSSRRLSSCSHSHACPLE